MVSHLLLSNKRASVIEITQVRSVELHVGYQIGRGTDHEVINESKCAPAALRQKISLLAGAVRRDFNKLKNKYRTIGLRAAARSATSIPREHQIRHRLEKLLSCVKRRAYAG